MLGYTKNVIAPKNKKLLIQIDKMINHFLD
jgi:hypothetical protein